ncbi:hypothetical protein WOLCODRAFT_144405 [Wolfiporia cocos MD-104 SS10]|uniref:Uncharacterized protein n=1 Tax=Wolfiporia cocos (strain MD-104) TaxID=742152 RepID=A0A2H3JLT3_WOLCO|nr:hypothetical protein WOLCODRAFT_144405 [Wolfiporia cocos MD-104 SS10]
MSSKTISNGTLGLRFMQNAQRLKQQAQVEAEQAKTKDDAGWSVAQSVRDAWGAQPQERVSYEASYLPFLFSTDREAAGPSTSSTQGAASALRGRRTFDKRGREVERTEPLTIFWKPEPEKEEGAGKEMSVGDSAGTQRRPKTISGFGTPLVTSSTKKDAKGKTRTKTAQMLIRETPLALDAPAAPVGEHQAGSQTHREGFAKPVGVDEPIARAGRTRTSSGKKRAREHEDADPAEPKGTKRNKSGKRDMAKDD